MAVTVAIDAKLWRRQQNVTPADDSDSTKGHEQGDSDNTVTVAVAMVMKM